MSKISWGSKLFFIAACFMGFIVFMVIRISQTDMPLVENAYYEKGIDYQKSIDAANRTDSLFSIQLSSNQLLLSNNDSIYEIKGSLLLYRPNDPKADHQIEFTVPVNAQQSIVLNQLEKGNWKCKMTWTHHALKFDKSFPINK